MPYLVSKTFPRRFDLDPLQGPASGFVLTVWSLDYYDVYSLQNLSLIFHLD